MDRSAAERKQVDSCGYRKKRWNRGDPLSAGAL
jgi:hypothetical protein